MSSCRRGGAKKPVKKPAKKSTPKKPAKKSAKRSTGRRSGPKRATGRKSGPRRTSGKKATRATKSELTQSGSPEDERNRMLLREMGYKSHDPPETKHKALRAAVAKYGKATIIGHLERIIEHSIFEENKVIIGEDLAFVKALK